MMSRLLLGCMMLACTLDVFAQSTSVSLNIHGRMGGAPFVMNAAYPSLTNDYFIRPTSLRFYITGISITHDGEVLTPVTGHVILADMSERGQYPLGVLPITQAQAITFFIGVDSARNHLDPTLYQPMNPLSPQDPTMHWGWAAGYKFVAYNGKSGTDTSALTKTFEVHGLGDENYFSVTVPSNAVASNGALTIDIDADFAQLLYSIDVSKGIIWHSNEGIAATELKNMSERVFSAASVTSVTADIPSSPITVAPMPTRSTLLLRGTVEGGEVQILDMRGMVISSTQTLAGTTLVRMNDMVPGIYAVKLFVGGKPILQHMVMHVGE